MTANALEGDRDQCLAAGMDDYVRKPVKPAVLLEAIRRWAPETTGAGSSAPASEGPPPLDLTRLLEPAGDDEDLARELKVQFVETAAKAWSGLIDALGAGDTRTVEMLAHRLKGSCWTLGAKPCGAALQQLETAAREGDPATDGEAFTRAETQFHRLVEWLTLDLREAAA